MYAYLCWLPQLIMFREGKRGQVQLLDQKIVYAHYVLTTFHFLSVYFTNKSLTGTMLTFSGLISNLNVLICLSSSNTFSGLGVGYV